VEVEGGLEAGVDEGEDEIEAGEDAAGGEVAGEDAGGLDAIAAVEGGVDLIEGVGDGDAVHAARKGQGVARGRGPLCKGEVREAMGGGEEIENLVFRILEGIMGCGGAAGGAEGVKVGADIALAPESPWEGVADAMVGELEDGEVIGVPARPDAGVRGGVEGKEVGRFGKGLGKGDAGFPRDFFAFVMPPEEGGTGDAEAEAEGADGADIPGVAKEGGGGIGEVEEDEADLDGGAVGGVVEAFEVDHDIGEGRGGGCRGGGGLHG
jgi:hypothetical protein